MSNKENTEYPPLVPLATPRSSNLMTTKGIKKQQTIKRYQQLPDNQIIVRQPLAHTSALPQIHNIAVPKLDLLTDIATSTPSTFTTLVTTALPMNEVVNAPMAERPVTSVCCEYCHKKLDAIEIQLQRLSKFITDKHVNEYTDHFSYSDTFPLKTQHDIDNLEEKLQDADCVHNLTSILRRYLPRQEKPFIKNFKKLIALPLLADYNLNGRSGKKALDKLKFINTCMKEAIVFHLDDSFEALIRKCVKASHNVFYVRKSTSKI